MRPQTQKRIDALHAEIARLVQREKDYMRRSQPCESKFLESIRDTRIEVEAWPPRMRERCYWATATLPAKDQT